MKDHPLLQVYFSATIPLPATAPTEGQPLTSQKHYTRRFAYHHLRTLDTLSAPDAIPIVTKPKKCEWSLHLESARRDASGKDQVSFPSQGAAQFRGGEFDPVGALIEWMAKGLPDEPETVTAVMVLREWRACYRLSGRAHRHCRDRRKTQNHIVGSMWITRCSTESEGILGDH